MAKEGSFLVLSKIKLSHTNLDRLVPHDMRFDVNSTRILQGFFRGRLRSFTQEASTHDNFLPNLDDQLRSTGGMTAVSFCAGLIVVDYMHGC
jgi:hypothetical protein